jgi:LytS/YehU family sensor histidine kinase
LTAFAVIVSVFYALIFILDLQVAQMPVARSLPFILITVYLIVFIASGIALLRHYYSSATRNDRLNTKVLEAQLKLKEQELKYLKMQIHPHFLFNTLNTLYGFALAKAAETPDMILKLSNLLDYLLYQVDKPQVSLSTEIAHIRDYIDLERMRFDDSLDIELSVSELSDDIQVAPMLLIPFVENAFKHGGRSHDNKLIIKLKLTREESAVHFDLENSINQYETDKEREGIGLTNIEKRLEMLYPNRHRLIINQDTDFYRVSLTLDTNE